MCIWPPPMTKPLLIIKTGSTFDHTRARLGDFEDWVAASLPKDASVVICDAMREEKLPEPLSVCGAIITGSHAMVTENPAWLTPVKAWLQSAHPQIPLFGICFGHQLLAATLGGEAGFHPKGPEIGCFDVTLTEHGQNDQLLGTLPNAFAAHLTHHQSALRLPSDAVVLAANSHEAHQAFRLGSHTWGVQFHPEFNEAAMTDYIEAQRDVITQHGANAEALLGAITPSPATALLARFYQLTKSQPIK